MTEVGSEGGRVVGVPELDAAVPGGGEEGCFVDEVPVHGGGLGLVFVPGEEGRKGGREGGRRGNGEYTTL